MKTLILFGCICFIVFSCTEEPDETSFFLTKLGNDTLAIERFNIEGDVLTADVILRSPKTSLRRYKLSWDERERLQELTITDFTSRYSFKENGGQVVQKITAAGDSLKVINYQENGDQTRMIANGDQLLPFVDMIHWPFELAFRRAVQNENDSIEQLMMTGRRNANFIIHRVDDSSYTLRHPSRGVMEVFVNPEGELLSLDAGQTTRKLKVERGFDLPFDVLATRFAQNDQIKSPFGTLSPAVKNEYYFSNTTFEVNYGSPSKRGRKIFGGIVPYHQRWRTGANRATHFKTSKDLIIKGQKLPAGEYTLYTIPEPTGGILIINSQTGQNGQAYDQSRDFMRVQMQRSQNYTPVEAFTIVIDEVGKGGQLKLMWDSTIYFIEFEIL